MNISHSSPDIRIDIPKEHALAERLWIDSEILKRIQIGENWITRDFNNVRQIIISITNFLWDRSLSVEEVKKDWAPEILRYMIRPIYQRNIEYFQKIEEWIPKVQDKITELDKCVATVQVMFEQLKENNIDKTIKELHRLEKRIQEIMDSPLGDIQEQVNSILE